MIKPGFFFLSFVFLFLLWLESFLVKHFASTGDAFAQNTASYFGAVKNYSVDFLF